MVQASDLCARFLYGLCGFAFAGLAASHRRRSRKRYQRSRGKNHRRDQTRYRSTKERPRVKRSNNFSELCVALCLCGEHSCGKSHHRVTEIAQRTTEKVSLVRVSFSSCLTRG